MKLSILDQSTAAQGRPESDAIRETLELARLCLRQASAARTPALASELRRMAKEYQARAAALIGGQLPDIGERAPFPSISRECWGQFFVNQRTSGYRVAQV